MKTVQITLTAEEMQNLEIALYLAAEKACDRQADSDEAKVLYKALKAVKAVNR
jgi:hypothetical protein